MLCGSSIVGLPLAVASVLFRTSSGYQYVDDTVCNFTFAGGDRPSFLLPEAGPNSPGDTVLNNGTYIVMVQNTTGAVSGCNGESSSYLVAGNDTWNTTFYAKDGMEYDIDIFYATNDDELWVRTIQLYMDPSLYEAINNTIVRLNVTCDGNDKSCVEFKTNFSEQSYYNYSAPYPFNDSCYHGFATGERVPVVRVPAAYPQGPATASSLSPNITIISAGGVDMGLPWSEAFEEDGDEKDDDEYWGPWWNDTHRRHGRRNSGDSSDDKGRRLALDAESDCTGNIAHYWDLRTGKWTSTYETLNGESHMVDMFFMQEVDGRNELWVESIEDWMAPSLYNQLQYTYVKLNLTCPSSTETRSCIIFEPRFTNWSPDIDGDDAGYRFYDPALPAIPELQEAWPNSPGEIEMNDGNPIVKKTGVVTETHCNGDVAEYYGEDGYWHKDFIGSDGITRDVEHVFYTKNVHELWSATIQSVWAPNLEATLTNRTVRLRIWCTNDEKAEYIFFRVGGEPGDCYDIPGLCTNATSGGATRATLTTSPFLATCIMSLMSWFFGR